MALPSSKGDREYKKFVEDASGDVAVRVVAEDGLPISSSDATSDIYGLVGKSSGGDFTTAYASGTTITIGGLPSYHATFLADDVLSVVQVATDGSVTATYNRDDVIFSQAGAVLTVTGAAFVASDTFVIYTNIARQVAVDSEFPAASALTDNFANPTTTNVASMNMGWDGSAWDRMPGDSTNGLTVNLGSNNDVTLPVGTGAMAASTPVTLATDDTQFGAVGAAADVDGNVHGQLRYVGETLATQSGKITACNTGAVVVASGAITETNSGTINTSLTNLGKSINGASAPTVTSVGSVNLAAVTGANQVVLAAQGANTQIWVTGYSFTVDTDATTVAFQDEDDTALATYGEGFAQYGGIQAPLSGNFAQPYFKVATNKALEVDVVTGTIGGVVQYAVVDVS